MMTDRLDLPLRDRNELEELLRKNVPDAEVWAYGSRVNGMSHPGSDLDLVLRSATLEPLGTEHIDLIDALEQSNIPIQVQAHDWAWLPKAFREEIQQDYVVLQKKRWLTAGLAAVVDLRLSSVDKKTKDNERPVLLCNYTDVYKNSFIHSDMNYMSATATDREISKCSLYAGDVIITKDSEKYDDIGVPALVREDVPNLVCGYHLAILRPLESVLDGAYLFYALNTHSVQHQFHAFANGITRFGLRKADIGLVRIPLPPLSEQRLIARVLRQLDDTIELNRRMSVTLEEMAVALFKSWFVNFDPVRAKVEGRWRPGESLPGLPAHLYDLFPDRLMDSEMGDVPEGWAVLGLDGVADFTNGLALQRFPPDGDEYLPVIKIAEMRRGYTDKTGKASRTINPRYIVEDGDVLFSWSGSLELVLWSHGSGALNQHLFKVTSDQYPRWFCWGWIREHLEDLRGIAAGKATTMGHIRRHHLTEARVAVPPPEVLESADTLLDGLMCQQVIHGVQNRNLSALRDVLLPKLVSGKLQVVGAEAVNA